MVPLQLEERLSVHGLLFPDLSDTGRYLNETTTCQLTQHSLEAICLKRLKVAMQPLAALNRGWTARAIPM